MITIIAPDDPALNALDRSLKSLPEWEAHLQIIPWAEYRDRLMEALTAGESPHQAVFVPGHVWLPELAEAGYLAALDEIETATSPVEQILDEMLVSVARECHHRGKPYLLPLFTDGHILFYREDLLGQTIREFSEKSNAAGAGVPVVSPLALAELAERVHRPPEVYGLALKAHPSEIFLDWLPYLWEAGGDLLDESGQPAFAGLVGIQALNHYIGLRRFCPPNTHEFGNAEIAEVIRTRRAALVTTWGGQAGPLYADGGAVGYGTAVFPRPWNATWGAAIPANQPPARQKQALELLLAAFNPQTDRAVIHAAGSPVRRSSYAPELYQAYPWLAAQKAMLERCGTLPARPEVGRFLGALYEAVYRAFIGEALPEAALKQAEAQARQALGL